MTSPEIPSNVMQQTINPWLLGADPEFAVVEPPRKTVLNSGETHVEFTDTAGGVGWDHGGRVWELRPAPHQSSYGVVLNLWRLLRDKRMNRVEPYKWKSGALGGLLPTPTAGLGGAPTPAAGGEDTLGGHVHFGIRALNFQQLAACNALTLALLDLDILPRKENMRRQALGHYGSFSHRVTESTNGHVEYRPAPSWLDTPGQAFCALTSYKLAAARPGALRDQNNMEVWPINSKAGYLSWIEQCAREDVDAFLLNRFIEKRGFSAVQADPDSDFKPNWRKEDLWGK